MAMKPPYPFKTNLMLMTQTAQGTPFAVRLNLRQVYLGLGVASFVFFTCLMGTLLFFREVERNRKLEERVLELETKALLGSPQWAAAPLAVNIAPEARQTKGNDTATTPTPIAEDTAGERTLAAMTPALPAPAAVVKPRIDEFEVDCSGEQCHLSLAMLPASSGVAQGQLLFVLETEIPHIGAGNPQTAIRERYLVYPGNSAKDVLNPEDLAGLEKKNFRFTRALQTSADFEVGKVLRPIAANVYVFGPDKSLLLHERKVIETVESYDH